MANSKISTYVIGMIMFTFFIITGLSLLNDFNNEPQYTIDNDKLTAFTDASDTYDNLNSTLTNLGSGILTAEPDVGILGALNALIQTAWNSLKALPTLFSFMNVAYTNMANFFGVPSWIPGLIILAITMMILFVIMSAIFQTEI